MAADRGGGGDRRGANTGGAGQTPDDAFKTRLRDLDARLRRVRRTGAPPEPAERRGTAIGLAFRLAVELVAGLAVGGAIGWYLDRWLGTLPIMLLLFFGLGAVAGILNVVRTARQMQSGVSPEGEDLGPDDDDD